MDISFSTPVINLKTSNGYGHAGSQIINSLKRLGHNVPFQDGKAKVQLNFSQPVYYKLHRNQYQISYTPWESTVVPKEWFEYLDHCDEVWTTSNWCKEVFESNGIKDVKVYPHGIDPIWRPKKRRIEHGRPIKFLHVGEPAPRKGGQMVVDAFTSMFGNNPFYSLTIKSYGPSTTRIYNNYIEKNIIGLPNELYNNITVITESMSDEELVKLYHDHDVLIYPSYGEGFGFIPLQALATGMPVICTESWAHYDKFLGPLRLKSEMIDSPWPFHNGKVFEPEYKHLLELIRDVSINFNAYAGYYFAQSTKIHEEYNWDRLTNKAFEHVFKKFS